LGQVRIYQSDSIIFDDAPGGNLKDTLSGLVREVIVDTIHSPGATVSYLVERQFRRSEDDEWEAPVLSLLQMDAQFAYNTEGNLRFVKMRFPLRASTTWEPTSYFNEQIAVTVGTETLEMYTNWNGMVLDLDRAENIGGLSFDSVMTCVHADDDNEIERRYVLEKYATGVGLVLRTDTILDSRCKRLGDLEPCFDESWNDKGEKGYILRQELISVE
jgi:hypothetical protein